MYVFESFANAACLLKVLDVTDELKMNRVVLDALGINKAVG